MQDWMSLFPQVYILPSIYENLWETLEKGLDAIAPQQLEAGNVPFGRLWLDG
jgi:hypothetical protein